MMHGYDTTVWLLMAAIWAASVVLIAVVALRVLRPHGDPAPRNVPEISPLEVLDQRYARGEIDTDEYLLRRQTLAERNAPR